MKAGTSSLNPYAASYIPLSRRGAVDESKGYEPTTIDPKMSNHAAWLGYRGNTIQNQYPKYSQSSDAIALPQRSDSFKHNNHLVFGSSSRSAEIAGKQSLDDDYDINWAYLEMTFPAIFNDSLSGFYTADKGDMEATVDKLNQLEKYRGNFTESLPDSLDIGDVSESGSSGAHKLKTTSSEGDTITIPGSWAS